MIDKFTTALRIFFPYSEFDAIDALPSKIYLLDHIGGFDENRTNLLLDRLQIYAQENDKFFAVDFVQIIEDDIKHKYHLLNLRFNFDMQHTAMWKSFYEYNQHQELTFEHFLCSFNGSDHVSRKLLAAILYRMNWFDPTTCSKNFAFTTDTIDGHLADYLDSDRHRYFRPFFIGQQSENFYNTVYSFGHVRYSHDLNIHNLERQLTSSFLHIVSESMATSYVPFVTEKFLYSVVTRGLFLAYAQPGWHDHLERYYGFRRYTKLFDYRFDTIQNPVERLVELMSMIAKFSVLSPDDWRDLYHMESETVEYNYDWYFGKQYLTHLNKISS